MGGGEKGEGASEKNPSENDQFRLVIFRAFFNIFKTNSKTSKVNQQSVLNL